MISMIWSYHSINSILGWFIFVGYSTLMQKQFTMFLSNLIYVVFERTRPSILIALLQDNSVLVFPKGLGVIFWYYERYSCNRRCLFYPQHVDKTTSYLLHIFDDIWSLNMYMTFNIWFLTCNSEGERKRNIICSVSTFNGYSYYGSYAKALHLALLLVE